jgi:hypothetical protein
MKTCPYCWEEIQDIAKKCRYCWEWLEEKENPKVKKNENKHKSKKDSKTKQSHKEQIKKELKEDDNIGEDSISYNQGGKGEISSEEYVDRKNILWWRFKNLVVWIFFGGIFTLLVGWTLKEWTVSYWVWLIIFLIAYQWWIDDMIINHFLKKWYSELVVVWIWEFIIVAMFIADCFIVYNLFTN